MSIFKKNACTAALTTVGLTTEIRSMKISHVGHGPALVADLIIMEKVEVCKKRVMNEKIPLQQIYREEMANALSLHKNLKLSRANYLSLKTKRMV